MEVWADFPAALWSQDSDLICSLVVIVPMERQLCELQSSLEREESARGMRQRQKRDQASKMQHVISSSLTIPDYLNDSHRSTCTKHLIVYRQCSLKTGSAKDAYCKNDRLFFQRVPSGDARDFKNHFNLTEPKNLSLQDPRVKSCWAGLESSALRFLQIKSILQTVYRLL